MVTGGSSLGVSTVSAVISEVIVGSLISAVIYEVIIGYTISAAIQLLYYCMIISYI